MRFAGLQRAPPRRWTLPAEREPVASSTGLEIEIGASYYGQWTGCRERQPCPVRSDGPWHRHSPGPVPTHLRHNKVVDVLQLIQSRDDLPGAGQEHAVNRPQLELGCHGRRELVPSGVFGQGDGYPSAMGRILESYEYKPRSILGIVHGVETSVSRFFSVADRGNTTGLHRPGTHDSSPDPRVLPPVRAWSQPFQSSKTMSARLCRDRLPNECHTSPSDRARVGVKYSHSLLDWR